MLQVTDGEESENTRGKNVLVPESKHPTKCWLDPFTNVGSWSARSLTFTGLGIVHPSELQI